MKRFKINSRKNIIIVLTSILVMFVAIYSTILLIGAKKFGIKEMNYYDLKCQSFSVQNANLSKGQIVFIGDSITDLFPLDDYFSDLPLATYNRGIGGDFTTGLYDRLQVSLYDIAPSKVVIMIGINDIDWGRGVNDIYDDYAKILNDIKTKLPDTQVFVMSTLPLSKIIEEYTSINADLNNLKVIKLNERISQLANSIGYTYVDLFSNVKDDNNRLRGNLTDDGIHLNVNGFSVWAGVIKPYLI